MLEFFGGKYSCQFFPRKKGLKFVTETSLYSSHKNSQEANKFVTSCSLWGQSHVKFFGRHKEGKRMRMVVGRRARLSTGPDNAETLGCLKRSGRRSLEGFGDLAEWWVWGAWGEGDMGGG